MQIRLLGMLMRRFIPPIPSTSVLLGLQLINYTVDAGRPDAAIRFHFAQGVLGRSLLGRILWLQGSPDQAPHGGNGGRRSSRG